MIPRKLILLAVLLAGLGILPTSCSNPDVRLGMGDGEGVRLSYRTIGKGSPLVVIHDGPGFEKSLMYGGFDPLSSDLRVIYYDQRGCGRSQPLSPLIPATVEANVEDLESLRRHFRLPQMSLAAHGWGAVIAIEYARKYGENLGSMILISPLSPFSPGPRLERVADALSDEDRHTLLQITNHPNLSMLDKRESMMRMIMLLLFRYLIIAPITSLNKAIKTFGAGDMSYRIKKISNDEIGEVAQGYNQMSESLERNYTKLT